MKTLVIKLGATGDVVRTTPLIRRLGGKVMWLTERKNVVLLDGVDDQVSVFAWEEADAVPDIKYDLVINLEDTLEVAQFAKGFKSDRWFGSYLGRDGNLRYTDDSRSWFDLSLISVYGRKEADRLKFRNRSTYQSLIFDGLGFEFKGEKYLLPSPVKTELVGDVAIAAETGPVWPMKQWAYFKQLEEQLEQHDLVVNVLPKRGSLLEHLWDVRNHKCLVGGDSLPMHFALGTRTPCVTLFTCTSPWEIHDYGIQRKVISPLLGDFFYKRGYNRRATTAISLDVVFDAVMAQLSVSPSHSAAPVLEGGINSHSEQE